HHPLRGSLGGRFFQGGFGLHLRSFVTTTKPKSSLNHNLKSVPLVLTADSSLLQAFGTVIVGLLLGLIGPDVNSGVQRFTFGVTGLQDGVSFVIVAMGVFGLGEIVANLGDESGRSVTNGAISKMLPSREDFRRMAAPIIRGTALGSLL